MTLDLLLIGLAIALEPLPVSAYILLLATAGGVRKGAGFLLGWILTLAVVVVVVVTVTGGKPLVPKSTPSTASLLAKILLGLLLLGFAWRTRSQRGRPRPEPAWVARLDGLTFVTAMALGFLLQPWPLVAAGAATVTDADLSNPVTLLVLVGFCVLASSSYLAMQGYVLVSPDHSRVRLDGLNAWLSGHRDQVVIVLSVVVGLWLITASGYRLAS